MTDKLTLDIDLAEYNHTVRCVSSIKAPDSDIITEEYEHIVIHGKYRITWTDCKTFKVCLAWSVKNDAR